IPPSWLDELELREVMETLCQDAVDAFGTPQWAQRYADPGRENDPRTGPLALPGPSITVDAQSGPVTPGATAGPELDSAERTALLPAVPAAEPVVDNGVASDNEPIADRDALFGNGTADTRSEVSELGPQSLH